MFHDFDKRLKRSLNRLDEICEENKQLILKFKSYCFVNDLSVPRVAKLVEQLVKMSEVRDKPFTEWTRDDIVAILEWVDERVRKEGLSPWTKREYKKTLKKFFKWLGKKELVDWFTIGEIKTRKFPDELLTEDEIRRLLEACKNPRDRALIAVLWESGCRAGELGNMRVRDVEFTEDGAWVKLFGKTGEKVVLLPFSTMYLSEWINAHPDPRPDNWLWVTLGRENYGSQMDYDAIRILLRKVAQRAGVKKKVNPHIFRHTRATELAKAGWSEVEMCLYMGWEIGSKMPRIYIHMVGRDIKRKIKEFYGLAEPNEEPPESR
jgi:integrase